jgi:AraC-like DNA-binding protein
MNAQLAKIQDWPEMAKESCFNADALAKQLNLSRWQLQRYIKSLFGQSPQGWLNEQRLILAAKRLKGWNQADPIKCLSSELGYKSESHFSHQFKQHYGLSPMAFLLRFRQQQATVARRVAQFPSVLITTSATQPHA